MDRDDAIMDIALATGALRAFTTLILRDDQLTDLLKADVSYGLGIILDRIDSDVNTLMVLGEKESAPAPVAAGTSAQVITYRKKNTTKDPEPSKPKEGIDQETRLQITQMLKNAVPIKQIAQKTGVSPGTIYKIKAEAF